MATRGWEHATPTDVRNRRAVVAKPSKYHAEQVTVDGIRFHRKAEAKRYAWLKLLLTAGSIRNLTLQPRFPLSVNGVRIGDYVADFQYEELTETGGRWDLEVEDVKGAKTLPLARWKIKHLVAEYGITVREIR